MNISSNSAARAGGCLCGKIRFEVTGIPDYPHVCSCEHCQKLAGSPMMSWVSFDLAGLTWTGEGEPSWYYSWPDSKRGFCPNCGSQLCAMDDGATSFAVTFSALDDASDLTPVNQSFRDNAVSWVNQIPNTQQNTVA